MGINKEKKTTELEPTIDLEYLLRTNGYLFPESANEVAEYERKFGDTDIILPDDMQVPTFLEKALAKLPDATFKVMKIKRENFAIAARSEQGEVLPDYIKERMENDRKKINKQCGSGSIYRAG